jgi:hypothetical protein
MNKQQPKDGSSRKFISNVQEKEDGATGRFHRINALPVFLREMIVAMMLDGRSSFSIAGMIQDRYECNTDITQHAFSALLDKYKATNGDTPMRKINTANLSPELRVHHDKMLLYYNDIIEKSGKILNDDMAKLHRLCQKENSTGTHDPTINRMMMKIFKECKKKAMR